MPEVCRFYGIVIRMYALDHSPPHFHAVSRGIAAGKATTMGHIQRHHLTDAKVAVPPGRSFSRRLVGRWATSSSSRLPLRSKAATSLSFGTHCSRDWSRGACGWR